jgi:nucleoside-diphosphate-sugar epimerase
VKSRNNREEMRRILVTGADGFVGQALTKRLCAAGFSVTGTVRRRAGNQTVAIGDVADCEQWLSLLAGVDVVVHLAARAHILREPSTDPLREFRRVNVAATLKIARAAAVAGVQRFIFLSSIGVNGVSTTNRAFVESDEPDPAEPYAISKWEAERGLMKIGAATGMEIVRVRPPLILGPGVKGNLRRLVQLVDWGLPLPFGAIPNRRSFIALDDICDLLALCIANERAANELFLAADPEQISTTELMHHIARGLDRRSLLIPVPLSGLFMVARILRAQQLIERMALSLCVNADRARTILSWTPRTGILGGIRAMAQAYRLQRHSYKV